MSAFGDIVDQLAANLGPLDDQDDNFSDGVNALADAIKAAEGEQYRIDYDVPTPEQGYVVRLAHRDGRRLKSVLPANRIPADGEVLLNVIASLARGLGITMLASQGIDIGTEVQTFTAADVQRIAKARQ